MGIVCLNSKRVFNSILEALTEPAYDNLSYSNISRCCKGEIQTAGKLKQTGESLQWCHLKDFFEHKDLPCIESGKSRWVVCVTDGHIFSNSAEACSYYGILPARLSVHLAGQRPSAGLTTARKRLIFCWYSEYKNSFQDGESINS